MPESVKRRSSSGPTIGAMLGFWSGLVAMGSRRIRFSLVSRRRKDRIRCIVRLLAAMWALEIVDVALDHQPRPVRDRAARAGRARWASWRRRSCTSASAHLLANTIPFVVMGLLIAFAGRGAACSR